MTFSIIIPVYNVAPYLRECLDSVLAQTYTEWEAICVDDGSTDGSSDILDAYAAKDSRLRVIHQANAGVAKARNVALDLALGEWVCFIDADDVVNCELLAQCDDALHQFSGVDMVKYRLDQFRDGSEVCWDRRGNPEARIVHCQDGVTAEVCEGGFFGRVYRRDRIADIRFPALVLGEDELYKNLCIERMSSVAIVDRALYGYRQRLGSAVHAPWTNRKFCDEFAWRLEWYRLWDKSGKRLPPEAWRGCALWMTERLAGMYFELSNDVTAGIWPMWVRMLKEVSGCRRFTQWQRFAVGLFVLVPIKLTAYILFYIPNWLKVKGLHR